MPRTPTRPRQSELQEHGSTDVLASTARALRREASALRDALAVEELLCRSGEHGAIRALAAG